MLGVEQMFLSSFTRGAQCLTRNMARKAFVRATPWLGRHSSGQPHQYFYALVLKNYYCTRKIILLFIADSFTLEELNRNINRNVNINVSISININININSNTNININISINIIRNLCPQKCNPYREMTPPPYPSPKGCLVMVK